MSASKEECDACDFAYQRDVFCSESCSFGHSFSSWWFFRFCVASREISDYHHRTSETGTISSLKLKGQGRQLI